MQAKLTLLPDRQTVVSAKAAHPAPAHYLLAWTGAVIAAVAALLTACCAVRASTYVVYIALDDPAYDELDKLNGMGLLDDYLSEIRPIARVEAARLTLEAQRNLDEAEQPDALAGVLIRSLREEFHEEIQWLENDHEDNPPTMIHPLERVEAQYIYSSGTRRRFALFSSNPLEYQAQEATPLLANNDGLPTSPGSNEILRISNWAGVGGFLTAYGETSVAGPIVHSPALFEQAWPPGALYNGSPAVTQTSDTNRLRLLRGGVVASIGNQALAFGYQEMGWGTGYFAPLSQGNNARAFPALTFQSVHPRLLPGFLRYLGPFRHQIFVGRLNNGRYAEDLRLTPPLLKNYNYPWISGQVIAFKPLPTFEFGLDHVIMFGGAGNSNYGWTGWLGRATGLNTGNTSQGNTNSRGGVFLKIYLPSLRNTEIYQEILGEDNLSTEFRPVGGALPFLSVSYQGGVYIPRVTADGLTDARFEYALIEPNYSRHDDSLYWAYYGQLMADPIGPDATEIDLSVGRWFNYRYRGDADVFYTERAPNFEIAGLSKERSGGIAIDVMQIPGRFDVQNFSLLGSLRVRAACEYVHDINWMRGTDSVRTMVLISGSLWPAWGSWIWH
ncbi:MAG TPA: capsule assembly Wzi family protein [Terriglobales bacterium]|nr:capsule assembly Wzi family protein [Terriglobales bacterium]